MKVSFLGSQIDNKEEDELRDLFRLSTMSIAKSEAKEYNMMISQPFIDSISDLAYKYAGTSSDISSPSRCTDFILLVCELKAYYPVSVTTEHLAVDLEQFAIHRGRNSVNITDVILSVSLDYVSFCIRRHESCIRWNESALSSCLHLLSFISLFVLLCSDFAISFGFASTWSFIFRPDFALLQFELHRIETSSSTEFALLQTQLYVCFSV
ncbi:hypothetical protein Tco_0906602 [Tanacetum coccineum]|uniref:Uncharacterized protein n=1 Tax=Tanacetum coccineum TaxID=301880 RepID=A0ABQ5CJP5_9ASTR